MAVHHYWLDEAPERNLRTRDFNRWRTGGDETSLDRLIDFLGGNSVFFCFLNELDFSAFTVPNFSFYGSKRVFKQNSFFNVQELPVNTQLGIKHGLTADRRVAVLAAITNSSLAHNFHLMVIGMKI